LPFFAGSGWVHGPPFTLEACFPSETFSSDLTTQRESLSSMSSLSASARKSRFPYILNSVLNQGFDSIYWCDDCRSFAIKDEEKFAQLLPLYFKSKNLSAFKRNLSHYGFKKAPTRRGCVAHMASPFSSKEVSVYYHEVFRKDDMQALDSMRVSSSVKKEPTEVVGPQALKKTESICPQKPVSHDDQSEFCGGGFFTTQPQHQQDDSTPPCGFKAEYGPATCTADTMASNLPFCNERKCGIHKRESKPFRRGSLDPVQQGGLEAHRCWSLEPNRQDNLESRRRGSLESRRRGSLESRRRGSLERQRRGSLEGIGTCALLDRISGVSLCAEDFHLRNSYLSNRSSTYAMDFTGLRMSTVSIRDSINSLDGVDLSREAFLRDQIADGIGIEGDIAGFCHDSSCRHRVPSGAFH